MNSDSNEEYLKSVYDGFMYRGVPFCVTSAKDNLEQSEIFQFRSNDILLSCFPKTGTHLIAEIVSWLVCPEKCTNVNLLNRVPFLEMHKNALILAKGIENAEFQELLREGTLFQSSAEALSIIPASSQRVIRTHLRLDFLSQSLFDAKPKIIHACRNPLDAAVSFFIFHQNRPELGPFKGTWDEFFELFINGKTVFGDYFEHKIGWASARDKLDILFVDYESIIENPHREVRKIAEFLGLRNKLSDELIEKVVDETSFKKMKNNPLMLDKICRKGIKGDWKNYFSEQQKNEMLKKFEEKLVPLGFEINY